MQLYLLVLLVLLLKSFQFHLRFLLLMSPLLWLLGHRLLLECFGLLRLMKQLHRILSLIPSQLLLQLLYLLNHLYTLLLLLRLSHLALLLLVLSSKRNLFLLVNLKYSRLFLHLVLLRNLLFVFLNLELHHI